MATYYISTSGNDTTGDGSSGLPWLTISKAHSSAASGDTIIVKSSASTYSFVNQTFTKSLTIQGESTTPSNQVFDGAAASVRWSTSTASITVTMSYLKFQNATNNQVFRISAASTFSFTSCVFDCSITISTRGSIFAGEPGGSTIVTYTFKNCEIRGMATSSGSGSKYFFNIENGGLTFTMTGCTVYAPAMTAMFNNQTGVASTLTIKNCIFYATTSSPFSSGSGTTTTATYSDFFQISSSPAGTGNITSDPLFVDAANNNFNLRPTSPCLNTGTLV